MNFTSLEISTFLISGSHIRYPLYWSLYPTKIPFLALGSNFPLPGVLLKRNTLHPNSLKYFTLGGFPIHASYGVFLLKVLVGQRFLIKFAVLTASAQNDEGNPD